MRWLKILLVSLSLFSVGCVQMGGSSKGSSHPSATPEAPTLHTDGAVQPEEPRKRKPRRVS